MAVRLQTSSDAGLHLLPNSVALSIGSVGAGWYSHSNSTPHEPLKLLATQDHAAYRAVLAPHHA